jgi:DNA-binding transcriptional MerR regulator
MRIADVERDTGIGKDTLRVWERRYHFPNPLRDGLGDRLYPFDQVERLRVIRRLLDKGMRPGKVLGLDLSELHLLLDRHTSQPVDPGRHAICLSLVKLLRMHRSRELRETLNHLLVRDGLQRFITDTIVPMNGIVGDYWIRGELTVPEEHLYTEQVQNVIRHAIHSQETPATSPRILFTTFPDEEHCLGILMVEAMCVSEGAHCTSLGTRIPITDIPQYAVDGRYDVVAISFSAAYPSRNVMRDLKQFRALLPEAITIWAGGAGLNQKRVSLPNVVVLTHIDGVPALVHDWKNRHSGEQHD